MDFYKEGNASQRPRLPAKNNYLNTCSQKIVQMYSFYHPATASKAGGL